MALVGRSWPTVALAPLTYVTPGMPAAAGTHDHGRFCHRGDFRPSWGPKTSAQEKVSVMPRLGLGRDASHSARSLNDSVAARIARETAIKSDCHEGGEATGEA